ncbi:MAG: hypothetical protein HFI90_07305, partial [Clostridia bacterium]|nr:hypothetical protein [Clostridia bacterium]
MKKRKLISIMLLVALLGTMFNFTVSAEEPSADGTRVIYEENFDNCDWFNNGTISEAASGKFVKKPFFDYLTDANLPITYTLENVQSKGADDTDKSLHINAEFTIPFGKKADGGTADDWSGDAGSVGGGGVGNNGMSHRMIVSDNNQKQLGDDEKYVHISFSAAQDPMPKLDIANGQGAGLEVTLDFATKKQDGGEGQATNLRLLEWTNENRRQRVFDSYYEVGVPDQAPMSANKWIKYDYVFYTDSNKRTLDIYLNGYPVIKGLDITNKVNSGGKPAQITGLKNLNFQVRDMNTGTETRDVNVYIDDVKVTYGAQAPVVSTYSVFGEAAKIDAPEQYVDRETGIVYNYGQSLNDMKKYFPDKNVYMVAKKTGSSQYPAYFDNFWTTSTSTSLESGVMSGDGSIANPALCVENGNFFYCYEVRQPQATNINPALAATGSSITLTWEGNAANCRGIEIFRDG